MPEFTRPSSTVALQLLVATLLTAGAVNCSCTPESPVKSPTSIWQAAAPARHRPWWWTAQQPSPMAGAEYLSALKRGMFRYGKRQMFRFGKKRQSAVWRPAAGAR
ncbi:hypothetical protein BOX15_Mlig023008g2 [Macrostomum lignano]|uniref:Uncharacterized protein n=1 Tax=Macrostomum lignano TaxID=282301 RepID=A0A267DNW4_9PLAT|nr:hypothetical protein BOX15_Mlig023008g2 [Macrostomum lignano]